MLRPLDRRSASHSMMEQSWMKLCVMILEFAISRQRRKDGFLGKAPEGTFAIQHCFPL